MWLGCLPFYNVHLFPHKSICAFFLCTLPRYETNQPQLRNCTLPRYETLTYVTYMASLIMGRGWNAYVSMIQEDCRFIKAF